jgi:hypothetical protein
LFAKIDQIFCLNFVTSEITTVFKFKEQLKCQPQFFHPNEDQTIFVTASSADGVYINLKRNEEVDIDETYNIEAIKEVTYDEEDRIFYILTNKYNEKLGFFVLSMREEDPNRAKFLIKWKNKLDIGDTNFYVLRNRNQ